MLFIVLYDYTTVKPLGGKMTRKEAKSLTEKETICVEMHEPLSHRAVAWHAAASVTQLGCAPD